MEKKSITLKKDYADAFKIFLKTNKIKYSPHEDGDSIYFSIETPTEMVSIINIFLDSLYYIYNQGFGYGYSTGKSDAEAVAKLNARVNTSI